MTEKFVEKRFSGKRAEKRYANELAFARQFSDLAPKIIEENPKELSFKSEYVEGDNYSFTEDNQRLIASALTDLHSSNLSVSRNLNSKLLVRYLASKDPRIAKLIRDSINTLSSYKYGTIHGDFRRRNIFITQERKVKVVDWEYAGNDLIYWDVAIFLADMAHQRYHGLHNMKSDGFLSEYLKRINLSKDELRFCRILGGLDIILDHIEPQEGEKLPSPRELFMDFSENELQYLLNIESDVVKLSKELKK